MKTVTSTWPIEFTLRTAPLPWLGATSCLALLPYQRINKHRRTDQRMGERGGEQEARCEVCGLVMHRFGYPGDGLRDDGTSHEPTAVACANSIIGLVEWGLWPDGPMHHQDAESNMAWLNLFSEAVTNMGLHIDSLRTHESRASSPTNASNNPIDLLHPGGEER